MNKKIITRVLQIIVFGFCIGMVIWGFWGRRKLMNNHSVTIAHIDDCSAGGRGNAGTLSIDFTIIVNGKTYST